MPSVATGVLRSSYANAGFRSGNIASRINPFASGSSPYASDGVNNSGTFRESHVAVKDTSGFRVVFGNFNADVFVAAGGGSDIRVTASIEYPADTITQVSFGGNAEWLIHPLQSVWSDPVMVSIPQGGKFWSRTFVRVANGGRWPLSALTSQVVDGEGTNQGVSVPDLTLGGSVPATSTAVYSPFAFMSLEPYHGVVCVGDSLTFGTGDAPQTTTGWPSRSFGAAHIPYVLIPRLNETAQNFARPTVRASRMALIAASATNATVLYGTNDLAAGRTALQIQGDLATIYAALVAEGIRVFAVTVPPKSTSTDVWATTVNQTTVASNAERVALNAWIRGVPTNVTGVIEFADQVESARDSGLWKAPGFTSEGTHPTPAGYAAVAAAVDTSVFV